MSETYYASPERSEITEIINMYNTIKSIVLVHDLMEKLDQFIFVLNEHRQTVYLNKAVIEKYNIGSPEKVLGLRPGEIFHCRFSDCKGGCGTSKFCKDCGAVNSILKSQLNCIEAVDECVICSSDGTTYELAVSSKPFKLNGQDFTIFSITDMGEHKRMRVLENIFFHDIINIAGGIHSMLNLMHETPCSDKEKIQELLVSSSAQLLNELNAHKVLKAAELNDLIVNFTTGNSLKILGKSTDLAENIKSAYGKIVYLDSSSDNFDITTDETLLNRVLLNMLTNALEASDTGDRVTACVKLRDGRAVFSVHNRQFIPENIRHNIFVKSFTTKKRGSGLGTHSIKMLTERYLGGSVDFESDEKAGTVFRVTIPVK